MQSVSFFDSSAEGFFHGMVLGLPGIIMEFKSDKDGMRDLDELAKEAYNQINDKKYDADMLCTGVNLICKYGIAFCREEVSVYSE